MYNVCCQCPAKLAGFGGGDNDDQIRALQDAVDMDYCACHLSAAVSVVHVDTDCRNMRVVP